jgi:hypothetical protein
MARGRPTSGGGSGRARRGSGAFSRRGGAVGGWRGEVTALEAAVRAASAEEAGAFARFVGTQAETTFGDGLKLRQALDCSAAMSVGRITALTKSCISDLRKLTRTPRLLFSMRSKRVFIEGLWNSSLRATGPSGIEQKT